MKSRPISKRMTLSLIGAHRILTENNSNDDLQNTINVTSYHFFKNKKIKEELKNHKKSKSYFIGNSKVIYNKHGTRSNNNIDDDSRLNTASNIEDYASPKHYKVFKKTKGNEIRVNSSFSEDFDNIIELKQKISRQYKEIISLRSELKILKIELNDLKIENAQIKTSTKFSELFSLYPVRKRNHCRKINQSVQTNKIDSITIKPHPIDKIVRNSKIARDHFLQLKEDYSDTHIEENIEYRKDSNITKGYDKILFNEFLCNLKKLPKTSLIIYELIK